VSTTAEYGDYVSGPRVVNDSSKAAMEQILAEIQDGTFAENFINEVRSGGAEFDRMREEGRGEQIEVVGKQLRGMMAWISPDVPE